jgi:uracil phosphoribosyltransferase
MRTPDQASSTATARLNDKKLPSVKLDDDLIQSILGCRTEHSEPDLETAKPILLSVVNHINSMIQPETSPCQRTFDATNKMFAKLLTSRTRDSTIQGPALRDVHQRIGWYLAHEFVADIMGIEPYHILHVQGYRTEGFRFAHEKRTLIVPLMRGGEPMAFGVSEALPLAAFLHAKPAVDITNAHMEGRHTIILVDGVVNKGGSMMEFGNHIRKYSQKVRIIMVVNVAHKISVKKGDLADALRRIQGCTLLLYASRSTSTLARALPTLDIASSTPRS